MWQRPLQYANCPLLQTVNPSAASVADTLTKPNTANLGTRSQNAAAELEAIISSRNGSTRALPRLTASPALQVGFAVLAAVGCCWIFPVAAQTCSVSRGFAALPGKRLRRPQSVACQPALLPASCSIFCASSRRVLQPQHTH